MTASPKDLEAARAFCDRLPFAELVPDVAIESLATLLAQVRAEERAEWRDRILDAYTKEHGVDALAAYVERRKSIRLYQCPSCKDTGWSSEPWECYCDAKAMRVPARAEVVALVEATGHQPRCSCWNCDSIRARRGEGA